MQLVNDVCKDVEITQTNEDIILHVYSHSIVLVLESLGLISMPEEIGQDHVKINNSYYC